MIFLCGFGVSKVDWSLSYGFFIIVLSIVGILSDKFSKNYKIETLGFKLKALFLAVEKLFAVHFIIMKSAGF